jgi:hypothetical protein
MTREVSRRNSGEDPQRTVRPDRVGRRGLDPKIVEDRPDPAPALQRQVDAGRGQDMDSYLGQLTATEGVEKLRRKWRG